jgi:hypothetical protein
VTNKIGTIFSGRCGKMIRIAVTCQKCHEEAETAIECPDCFKDVPDGFLVYVDDKGQLQVMEEDPHDYR